MNKSKLNTEDGSQFTVFYLNNKQEPKPPAPPSDVYGISLEGLGSSDLTSVGDSFESLIEQRGEEIKIPIDDTIESDFIKNPIRGRIYKIKSLNIVVRFVDYAQVVGVHSKNYASVKRHNASFLAELDDLIKATEFEVEKYLEKSVD